MVALTECAIAAGVTGVELLPSKVSRHRFEADLVMDHCTMTSERSIVRIGPWLGLPPGPDRPWLITSRNCAFLAMYDRKTRETVLLRADADALAAGRFRGMPVTTPRTSISSPLPGKATVAEPAPGPSTSMGSFLGDQSHDRAHDRSAGGRQSAYGSVLGEASPRACRAG